MIEDDLTTGPIRDHFRKLAVPAAIGMLFSTLYNIVDTFYVGTLAPKHRPAWRSGFRPSLFSFQSDLASVPR